MKKILTFLLIIISMAASAQSWTTVAGSQRFTGRLGIPTKDTVTGGTADSSQMVIRPADGQLWYKYKGAWVKASGDLSVFVKYTDTAAMLSAYRIKNISQDASIAALNADTATLAARFLNQTNLANSKLALSDTAAMLAAYRTGIIALNADTATLASRFTNQTNLANSKIAISDSAAMLANYRTGIIALNADTATLAARFTNQTNLANSKIATSLINANNGVAGLDAGGKVPFSLLPAALMIYKGTWNVATNTPTLSDATGVSGWVYIVSTGGTVNTGSGNITYSAGDYAIHNGTAWQRSVGTNNVASVSVNGSAAQQGVVSITLPNSSVTNAMLANTSVTINGNLFTLGGSGSLINGTGFVKASGTTISYDNSTYLTTSSAASAYLALSGGTLTGGLSGTSASFTGNANANDYKLASWKILDWSGSVAYIGGITASQFQQLDFYTNGTSRVSVSNTTLSSTLPISGTSANFANAVKGYSFTSKGGAGGWDRSFSFEGSTGTNRGGFGAFGADNSLDYYYIGNAFNDYKVQINASTGAVVMQGLSATTGDFSNMIYGRTGEYLRSIPATVGAAQYQTWHNSAGTRRAYFGFGSANDNLFALVNESGGGLFFGGETTISGTANLSSGSLLPNGVFYRANRLTGSAAINLLGIESGTDNTVMVASNYFKLRNTGTGDAANLFTVDNYGNAVLTGYLTASSAIFTNEMTVTAGSGGQAIATKGRSSDNVSFHAFYSNNAGTRYGYMQAAPTNGGQIVISGDGGATITLDNAGARSTGSFTASSLIKSGASSTDALMGNGSTQTITSSTYTPTFTGALNTASASSAGVASYLRVGNFVTISGQCTVTATTGNSTVLVEMSVPVNSAMTNNTGGAGVYFTGTTPYPVQVTNSSANKVLFSFKPPDTSGNTIAYTVSYYIN